VDHEDEGFEKVGRAQKKSLFWVEKTLVDRKKLIGDMPF